MFHRLHGRKHNFISDYIPFEIKHFYRLHLYHHFEGNCLTEWCDHHFLLQIWFSLDEQPMPTVLLPRDPEPDIWVYCDHSLIPRTPHHPAFLLKLDRFSNLRFSLSTLQVGELIYRLGFQTNRKIIFFNRQPRNQNVFLI